jgi:hypothetical protein
MKQAGSGTVGTFRKSSMFYIFSGELKKRMQNLQSIYQNSKEMFSERGKEHIWVR